MKNLKTFKIITFGCRVNQAESRQMGEKLASLGLKQEKNYKKADLILINTCTITHKADREVRKQIRRIKRENKTCYLAAAGCWIEKQKKDNLLNNNKNQKEELFKKIDLFLTNKQKLNIDKFIKQLNKDKQEDNKKQNKKNQEQYKDKYAKSKKAIIKIQDGCNNFCTYCIVPYVRGRSKSKKLSQILKEIRQKQKQGIKEIILTGIDIADFKIKKLKTKNHLAFLLKEILKKTNIEKISYGSINLKAITKEFLDLYKNKVKNKTKKRLSSHFHIPIQSGSNKILKRMGRNYTKEQIIKTIKKLNKNIKNFTFSTDIIVGFPDETEKEFLKTKKTLKTIKNILKKRFTHIHTFRYSQRQGTTAQKQIKENKWKQIKEITKKKRASCLNNLLK
jgi:threonylcarbamoyladenosine tRNA methylthiotransferase MtaB